MQEKSKNIMAFNEWLTPPEFMKVVDDFYKLTPDGQITIDPACSQIAADFYNYNKRGITWYDQASNGLKQRWEGNIWCNPPYSRGDVDAFAEKFLNDPALEDGLLLVNAASDTKWQQRLLEQCDAVLFIRGRLKFWKMFDGKAHATWPSETTGVVGNNPRYTNVLFYSGLRVKQFQELFKNFGVVVKL